jgi:hypothetical protein
MHNRIIAAATFAAVSIASSTNAAARIWCYLKSNYISGTSRICIYDCAGTERHETVGAAQLCPLNIEQ